MKSNALHQYVQLRSTLLKEKARLEAHLARLNKALAGGNASAVLTPAPAAPAARVGRKHSKKRAKNTFSLKEAVLEAIKDKALTKPEILEAIHKSGYKFAAKNPMNSLNVLLYTDKSFNKADGKFSAAK